MANKKLIARVLGVGKGRIILDEGRKEEINEAITRQDIREMLKEGIVRIREVKGRKVKKKMKRKRTAGKIRISVKKRKQGYIIMVRKLRDYLKNLRKLGKIDKENYQELRKKIKSRMFSDLRHLTETIKMREKK